MSEHVVPQEDRLELPEEWRRLALPRRANGVCHPIDIRPQAEALFAERLRHAPEAFRRALDYPRTDPALIERAEAYVAGEADPLGAAVAADLLDRLHTADKSVANRVGKDFPLRGDAVKRNHLEAMTLRHGLPFAAAAAVEQLALRRSGGPGSLAWFDTGYGSPSGSRWSEWIGTGLLAFMRQLIRDAHVATYEQTVAVVAARFDGQNAKRYAAAVLLPDEHDWVTAVLTETWRPTGSVVFDRLEWSIMGTVDHLGLCRNTINPKTFDKRTVADLLANLGPQCLAVLTETLRLKSTRLSPEELAALHEAVALIPSDAAMHFLLDRDVPLAAEAARAAADRFPERAKRIVAAKTAEAKPAERQRLCDLLGWVRLPDADDDVEPNPAPPEASLPDAPLEDLPPILVSPPWTMKRKSKAPKEISGLEAPAPQLVGRTGEFEAALALEPDLVLWDASEWHDGPEFTTYRTGWNGAHNCLEQLARKGVAVADAAASYLNSSPWSGRALLPIRSAKAAGIAAHWFLRLKDGIVPGLDWFDRHGLHAVPHLVPIAFGPKLYQRTTTRGALRLLAWRFGADAVVRAAEPHGAEAVAAVAALFDADPNQPLLNDPKTGWWCNPEKLPPVLTADRSATLPPDAARHLVSVLSQWAPRVPYPGVAAAAEACDRDSLARFSLALAAAWIDAGAPTDDDWAIGQLAYFGLPEAAELLETNIPRWGGRQAALSSFGLETLAAFPATIAFPPLYRLSRGAMKTEQRANAAERARAVAERLDTEPEALADRIAPALGLDDPAAYVIDYGPRAFHVKTDERLNFSITDAAGKPRARLPRPGVRDDADVAAASIARYRKLTKDLKAELAFQSARLEDSMLDGRLWTAEEFARLTANPVLASLARGLLWMGRTGGAARCFRLAEDGSFADIDDKPFTLDEDSFVRLAHPVFLGADLAVWTGVFGDYEILQPFAQLARPALGLFPEEAEDGVLHRFTGASATFAGLCEVMDLRSLDLVRDRNLPVERSRRFMKTLPGGVHLLAEVDPVLSWSDPEPDQRLKIEVIWFAATKNRHKDVPTVAGQDLLDAVDPVLMAEILAGLGRAAGIHH